MSKIHVVLIIPGLGDHALGLQIMTNHWKWFGCNPMVFTIGWRDSEREFQPKLNRLVQLVSELKKKGNTVSLVGTSAGGSAALNVFMKRKNDVHAVINVCGRLRIGPTTGFRSFEKITASSPAFAQSVILAEKNAPLLTEQELTRIMTVRPMFGDELVPADTVPLPGATNISIPTSEHLISIGAALTIFSRPLIQFIYSRSA